MTSVSKLVFSYGIFDVKYTDSLRKCEGGENAWKLNLENSETEFCRLKKEADKNFRRN